MLILAGTCKTKTLGVGATLWLSYAVILHQFKLICVKDFNSLGGLNTIRAVIQFL